MANSKLMRIEVVYPLPHEQLLLETHVPEGASLREGILASGVLARYPELSLDTLEAGIFGKLATLDERLRERDRIEIYRPLIADPKAVRKQRAAEGKRMKRGGGDVESDEG
jgi:putative ubiquitin-RnfH superfamily antitoxin RatB of RatAB toxin-antitoxin module